MKKLLMILTLVLILCFVVGCQDKAAMAELEKFRAQAEIEEQNKALVKRFYEEFNKGNFEIMLELCAPDYKFYYPSNNPKPRSREETIEILKMIKMAFPDFNWAIEEIIAVEDKVITRMIESGTHKGEYFGIPASGIKFEVGVIFITRIENGKIVEDRDEYDLLGMMQQIGMELKPKEK